MIILTWMLSSGLFNTGIICPMAGSIWLMWLTSKKKPDNKKPNTITMRILNCIRRAISITSHATLNILSYPFDRGMLPLMIHLSTSPKVKARKDMPNRIGRAMSKALKLRFLVMR